MNDSISVYEVLPHVLSEHLAAYLVLYGQILRDTSHKINNELSSEIMLDRKYFISVHQLLGCRILENAGHCDLP